MKFRTIAVQVPNEIKQIPNDFFSTRVICRLSSIMTVLKGKHSLSSKLNIPFQQGGCHHKVLMTNEPQTLDPFTEWLNIIFKYTNIYLKNGALLLWNL